MSSTTANVSAAKPRVGGAISAAAIGTALPTDAVTDLAEAFKNFGYISEDGLSNSGILNPDIIKAWGGDGVLTLSNGDGDRFKFKMIEVLNVDVLKYVFGEDNVSGTLQTGIEIAVNDKERPEKALVIDMVMRNGALKRIVVPNAMIIEVAEVNYTDSDAVGYEVTIQANKDSSDNNHYEYMCEPVVNNG